MCSNTIRDARWLEMREIRGKINAVYYPSVRHGVIWSSWVSCAWECSRLCETAVCFLQVQLHESVASKNAQHAPWR